MTISYGFKRNKFDLNLQSSFSEHTIFCMESEIPWVFCSKGKYFGNNTPFPQGRFGIGPARKRIGGCFDGFATNNSHYWSGPEKVWESDTSVLFHWDRPTTGAVPWNQSVSLFVEIIATKKENAKKSAFSTSWNFWKREREDDFFAKIFTHCSDLEGLMRRDSELPLAVSEFFGARTTGG